MLTLPLLFAFVPRLHQMRPASTPDSGSVGSLSISAPHPNPFTDFTQLTLMASRTQLINVEVVNLTGQRKAFLFEGMLKAGEPRSFRFGGGNFPSGVYFFMIRGENLLTSRKVVLAR